MPTTFTLFLLPANSRAPWVFGLLLALLGTGVPVMAAETITDLDGLQRPSSPNTWLVAPAARAELQADASAPVFDASAAALAAAWRQTVLSKDRTTLSAESEDGLQIEAEQRSTVFGFVDDISFRAIPQADGGATFIAYSRSRIGYWDLGANRKRLTDWIASLQQQLGEAGRP